MEAGKRTINDIFNGNRILEIPFFQRSYVWDEPQWERLLEDMETISVYNKPYFLGSVILKQKLTQTENECGDIRTVIDGQQRMTTLNIFFKVLFLKTDKDSMFYRIFRLINTNEIALQHNHNDVESFNKILSLEKLEDMVSSKDNIINCYLYFKKNIKPEKLNINNILSKVLFVGIDLVADEDEQQIFDTINSLGVRLTTAELLKNYFFNRDERSLYEKYWKKVFEKDDETKNYWDLEITTGRTRRTLIDMFFYAYLQIKIQDTSYNVSTEDKLEFSKVESLFESYKNFIKNYNLVKTEILDEIKSYAEIFKKYFDLNILESELPADYGIERINAIIFGLETSTLIPYVLYILKNISDDDEKNDMFRIIESYIMRRIVTHATTKNYNQLFTDRLISNKILSSKAFLDFIEKNSDQVNYFPNDEDVLSGFRNSVLINKQTSGILYFIESKIRDRSRHSTQLLGLKKYSLEHIMPKKWENNWGKLDSKEATLRRNKKLLTLGNLAIITQSLNASIRDADWKTKKQGKGNKNGLIEYSAGIETLSKYLNLPDWNEEEIEKRADCLSQAAIEIWEKS